MYYLKKLILFYLASIIIISFLVYLNLILGIKSVSLFLTNLRQQTYGVNLFDYFENNYYFSLCYQTVVEISMFKRE